MRLNSLSIDGTVSVVPGHSTTLYTRALSLAPGATLDLADNDLIVDYSAASPMGTWNASAYAGVAGLIASGRNGGTWGGAGIVASQARATGNSTTLRAA